jgi:iron complex transport system ATP-binding protein
MNTTAIEMHQVTFSYSNGAVLRNVDLSVHKGEMVGLIGPNGAGKTTLIRLLSGILDARHGDIHLDGMDTRRLKRSAIAREVAVVPQQFNVPFAYKVDEVVMLGRTPFMKPWRDFSAKDWDVVLQTMDAVGISSLAKRCFTELSGGERQKVVLAMALAQETGLLLLDEPTAHLDISHQVEILELLTAINQRKGLTILAAMHDLNLASAYFRRLVMLKGGAVVADGSPQHVLTSSMIGSAYSVPVHIQPHPLTGMPQVIVLPSGNGHRQETVS